MLNLDALTVDCCFQSLEPWVSPKLLLPACWWACPEPPLYQRTDKARPQFTNYLEGVLPAKQIRGHPRSIYHQNPPLVAVKLTLSLIVYYWLMGKSLWLTGTWCKAFTSHLELGHTPGDQGGTMPGVNVHALAQKVIFLEQKWVLQGCYSTGY